jgi:hypothetical protein
MISKALLIIHFGETFGCTRCMFERYSTNYAYPCAFFPLETTDKKALVCKEFFIKEKNIDKTLFLHYNWIVEYDPIKELLDAIQQ